MTIQRSPMGPGWLSGLPWVGATGLALASVMALGGLGRCALAAQTTPSDEPWHHLPDSTALALLLDTRDRSWGQLSRFQLFRLLESSLGWEPGLPGLPLLPAGLDFQTQVQPWLGDWAMLALLPAEPGAAIADHLVLVAPIADRAALTEHRAALLGLDNPQPPDLETFGDTVIYLWPAPERPEEWVPSDVEGPLPPAEAAPPGDGEWPTPGEKPGPELSPTFGERGLALALLPEAVVAAESAVAIKQYLAYRQSNQPGEGRPGEGQSTVATAPLAPLVASPQFQRTLANQAETQALMAVYGNALELLNFDLSTQVLPVVDLPLPPLTGSEDWAQSLRALNFGGTLEALVYPTLYGLQVRGRYYYDAVPFTLGLTPAVPEAAQLLDYLPASTLVMASGRGLAGGWQSMVRVLSLASDDTNSWLEWLRGGVTALTGLDLDRDVLGWMDGEFAIAAFPSEASPLQYLGLGVLLQTGDRPTAEATLTDLDSLVPGYGFSVAARTVNQQPAVSWELVPDPETSADIPEFSFISHGWLTDDTLAITSGVGPMDRLMAPSPHDPLAEFFLFKQATATFPQPNNGYVYFNAGATLALFYQVFDPYGESAFFAEAKPFLGSLRFFSATTAQTPRHIEFIGVLGLAPHRD